MITPAYTSFIQTVALHNQVWALSGAEGLAMSSAEEHDSRDVIPFWSDEAGARAAAVDDWDGYKPEAMPLALFLEHWLVRMHNEEVLVGIDWDASLSGEEVEPLIVALDLAKELETVGKEVAFTKYKDLKDFMAQVRDASGLS